MTSAPDAAFWASESDALMALLTPYLNTAASDGADAAAADLAASTGVGIDMTLVNTDVQAWVKSYGFDLVKGITDTTAKFLQSAVDTWVASGAPLDDLVAALEPAFGADRAKLVAQTESTRAYHTGNVLSYRDSGVVDGYTFHTVNDAAVCPICEPLDGETFALDDDTNAPPQHPACRCYSSPAVTLP